MSRHVSIIVFALLCVSSLAFSGCGGPTKKGIEARSAAAERVNMVSAQVGFDQARRSFETGDLDRALREVNNAIARYENIAQYHLLKGRVLLEQHRLEQAYRSFATAMEIEPSLAQAHYFSGIINQRWSRHDQAHENYLQASQHDPENVQYVLAAAESLIPLHQYAEARSLVESSLERHEHNSALRHLLGHLALLDGDPVQAAELLADARLLNPDDLMLLEELAYARFDAGQYARSLDAVRELYRHTESKRHRNDLRHLEARALSRMERYVEARRIYIELSQRMPADADIWIELAAVALELGDDRRLDQGSAQAISVAPQRYEGYLLRAVFERERGNPDQAERLFIQAIERAQSSDTVLSAVHRKDDGFTDESVVSAGGLHLSYLLYGQFLEESDRIDEARSAYAAAVEVRPESAVAHALLSHVDQTGSLSSVIEPQE